MIIIVMTYYLLAYALLLYCTFDLLRASNSGNSSDGSILAQMQ